MINEFPAYSWQRLCRWLDPLSRTENRGVVRIRRETRGCIREQATILTTGWGVGLLARLHGPVRSVGEVERGCLYASRHSRGCRYIYIRTSRARNQAFERPEQIFGASPLKTRDEPTDELICFPTLPLSSLSFFDYLLATLSSSSAHCLLPYPSMLT